MAVKFSHAVAQHRSAEQPLNLGAIRPASPSSPNHDPPPSPYRSLNSTIHENMASVPSPAFLWKENPSFKHSTSWTATVCQIIAQSQYRQPNSMLCYILLTFRLRALTWVLVGDCSQKQMFSSFRSCWQRSRGRL